MTFGSDSGCWVLGVGCWVDGVATNPDRYLEKGKFDNGIDGDNLLNWDRLGKGSFRNPWRWRGLGKWWCPEP